MLKAGHNVVIKVGLLLVILGLCAALLLSSHLIKTDLHYFILEKKVSSWELSNLPSIESVKHTEKRLLSVYDQGNPNILSLYAVILEWKAYLMISDARFLLTKSEVELKKVLDLRPTSTRNWAYLARIKMKLGRPVHEIQFCINNAIRYGAGDRETQKLLNEIDIS